MLNISLSTGFLHTWDYREVLNIISQTKCSNIELFTSNYINVPLIDLEREIIKNDLTVNSIHTPLDFLLRPDEDESYWILKCIEIAKTFGAKIITTHIVYIDKDGTDENVDDQHKRNLEMFANNDIIVCTENLPLKTSESQKDSFLRRYTKLKEFITKTGVFMTYDTTHWASTNTSILDGYEYFKGHIRNIHLSDYRNGIEHMILGTGDIQITEFIKKLHDDDYSYPLTIELDLESSERNSVNGKEQIIEALNTSIQLVYDALEQINE